MNDKLATFAESKELSSVFAKSSLVPDALRGKEADILFIVMTGAEMGLGPLTSLRAFEIIKGRVGMKPEAMIAHVRSHPSVEYVNCVENTAKLATWASKLKGGVEMKTSFSWEDAVAAGLSTSEMYKKWPARMLQWRCASAHCKKAHSDVILGLYSTEEVESFGPPSQTAKAKVDLAPVKAAVAEAKAKKMVLPPDAPKSEPVLAPIATPEVKAKLVESLKAVGVTDAKFVAVDDPSTVGWGKHAKKNLAELSIDQLRWFISDATKKASTGDELWCERQYRYEKALEVAQAQVAAELSPGSADDLPF
jgi:hypothetical protein